MNLSFLCDVRRGRRANESSSGECLLDVARHSSHVWLERKERSCSFTSFSVLIVHEHDGALPVSSAGKLSMDWTKEMHYFLCRLWSMLSSPGRIVEVNRTRFSCTIWPLLLIQSSRLDPWLFQSRSKPSRISVIPWRFVSLSLSLCPIAGHPTSI